MAKKQSKKESIKLVKGCTIPTRPTVMLDVIKAQNRFAANPSEVIKIILEDMALSASVLQASNTLLSGYNRKVGSIECAVALLGQDKLREISQELFLSAGLIQKGSQMQTLRHQGVKTAQLMAWLCKEMVDISNNYRNGHLPLIPEDEAYVVGMFHDCGKIVLLQRFGDYENLLTQHNPKSEQTLEELENASYQTNHSLLGSLLCESWQLPKPLTQIIKNHHQLEPFASGKPIQDRKYAVMHALLFLADYIKQEITEWEWNHGQDHFQHFFDVKSSAVQRLCIKAREVLS